MLTYKERHLLLFVQDYMTAHGGVAPSFVEMMEGCNLSSRSLVTRRLRGLQERGFVRVMPRRARAIEVLRPAPRRVKYFVFNDETKAFEAWAPNANRPPGPDSGEAACEQQLGKSTEAKP